MRRVSVVGSSGSGKTWLPQTPRRAGIRFVQLRGPGAVFLAAAGRPRRPDAEARDGG